MGKGARNISDATLKSVFALSGNRCAFPVCQHTIINEYGQLHAQLAHIKGVGKNAARFDANATDTELASPENLILLCYDHHLITNDQSIYTVEKMKSIKQVHEKRFGGILTGLRTEIEDVTKATITQFPVNMKRYQILFPEYDLDDVELEDFRRNVIRALNEIQKLPPDVRSVMATIVDRGTVGDSDRIEITEPELRLVLDISSQTLSELLNILVQHDFIWIDHEAREGYATGVWVTLKEKIPNCPGFPFFYDLKQICEESGIAPSTLLVDLDWRNLDGGN